MTTLTKRYEEALVLAHNLHLKQKRKGNAHRAPYIAHCLAVSSLILENGGDEDTAIAGLLHDSVEDQNYPPEKIEEQFGVRVREIVENCTHEKMDWKAIPKETHLAVLRANRLDYFIKVAKSDYQTQLCMASDKLHNSRSILLDFDLKGIKAFDAFRGGVEGTLWYYEGVAGALKESNAQLAHLADSILRVVRILRQRVEALGVIK